MKFILIASLTVVCFLNTTAQTSIAVRGGFNYSTVRAYYSDGKQRVGFVPGGNIGLQVNTVFEGLLHFSPFVGYNSRGFIIKSKTNGDKTQNFIHYIDIAALLSIHKPMGGNNSFAITAGPVISLAIAGTEKTTIAGISNSSKMKFSTSGDYGPFDFGLQAAVGYHFKKIFVEAAYQYGFVNINNNEEHDKRNIRNRTISLNLGYYIRSYK